MFDFLAITLAGQTPEPVQGENSHLDWHWLSEGILCLQPKSGYRKAVLLSAGIHGNETAPIELLNGLVGQLLRGERQLTVRLLVIFGNVAAMRANKRYLTQDMNRLFGGRHQSASPSAETEQAAYLEQQVAAFFNHDSLESGVVREHYDMHTAIRASLLPRFVLLPYQQRAYSPAMLDLLDAADLDAIVVHRTTGGTFSNFSSEYHQADSCTLELGKALPFGQNALASFAAIEAALAALISGETLPTRSQPPIRWFRVAQSLIKRSEDFQLHLADSTANFTDLPQGTLLTEQTGDSYRVQHDKEWILFPNPKVALGLRAGLMLTEETDLNAVLAGE